jgi:diguanylate cyclase (GGDEF)-like protein/PAS domain S-box-containing protein
MVVAIAVAALVQLRQQSESRALVAAQNLATSMVLTMDGLIGEIDIALQTSIDEIGREMASGKFDPNAFNRFLVRQEERLNGVGYLRRVNQWGDIVFGPDILAPPGNIADRDYFNRLRDDANAGLVVAKAAIGRTSRKWIWPIARRVDKPDGSFGGVIFVAIYIDKIEAMFDRIKLDPGESVGGIRSGLLALARHKVVGENNEVSPPIVEALEINADERGAGPAPVLDDISRTYATARSAKYGFAVNVGIARDAAMADWRNQVRIVAGLVVAFIVASAAFTRLIMRSWSQQERDVAALVASRQSLHEAQEIANLGHFVYRIRDDRYTTSDILNEIIGIEDDQPIDMRRWSDLIVAESRSIVVASMKAFVDGRLSGDRFAEYRIRRANDGEERWLQVKAKLERDPRGRPALMKGTVQDITERKHAEDQLRLSASVFLNSYEGIVITDARKVIVDVNPAFARITGYSHAEAVGQTPKLLASGRHQQDFYTRMWKDLRDNDFWHGEIWNRRKNGEVYAEMLSISVIRDGAGRLQHYIGIFSDISQIKEQEAELNRIAHFDTLTGVPNRRLLADRLGQAIARARRSGKPMAVCYLDLDGFKPINDRHGHAAGDQLLIGVADHLKGVLRAEDTLARLGGDEFVLLFTDLAQVDEIHVVLDRVLAAVSEPVMVENNAITISASIGVTLYPADDSDADALLRHADQAMYRAKESGKNRYHLFDPKHDREARAHRDHLLRLREALENGEFVLHYQPKVDLVSGAVVGAEALIRWQHPEQGLLLPGNFLHYMEGSDLEIAVGEWVINKVLDQIAAWNKDGLSFTVSANVSADHLLQPDFAERLRTMLDSHPTVPPESLELEILETAALSDMQQAALVVNSCRQFGVQFAMDDFGTGYSSLNYFRSLPVQMLKIDQSFVREILDNPDDLSIVDGVVQLANAFNRPVIAEGVETLEHGAMLVHFGCRLAQGYGIARPMPATSMRAWVDQWQNNAPWLTLDTRFNSTDEIPVMVAAQSYRNWIDSVGERLRHPEDEISPRLDSNRSRFGRWYQNSGAARYSGYAEFQAIAPLHEKAFALGEELVEMAKNGQAEAAEKRLPELYKIREKILKLLDELGETAANDPA